MKKKLLIFVMIIVALILISPNVSAVEFGSNSANIDNEYFNIEKGVWSLAIGFGDWDGTFTYFHVVGKDVVSGAQIETQIFNNVGCLKVNRLDMKDTTVFNMWFAQDTDGNVWILKVYVPASDSTYMLGTHFFSMFIPDIPSVGFPMGIIIPETASQYCKCVQLNVAITTNFGSYVDCAKAYCYHGDGSKTEVSYICAGIGHVRETTLENPAAVMDLNEYGIATTTKTVVIPLFD